jgi:hypothetical protein
MAIVPGRMTVDNSEGLVVFAIGARINKWWMLPIALPILATMPRMLKELAADPDSGFLGVQPLGFGGMLQYWKSVEHLNRYANDKQRLHQPAWLRFMRRLFKNEAAGIWHETYVVAAGAYECIYTNMPRHGLGRFKELVPASGHRETASARLSAPTTKS